MPNWADRLAKFAKSLDSSGVPPAGGGATEIDDLTDVDTSTVSPTNGQALVYETSSSLWKPGSVAAGGGGATAFIGAKAYGSAISVTRSAYVAVPLASESFDTDGFHDPSTNPSRFTIPAGLGGKYQINAAAMNIEAHGGGSELDVLIYKNGASMASVSPSSVLEVYGSGTGMTDILDLVPGDYIELVVWCNYGSGGTTSMYRANLSIAKLDSGTVGSGIGVLAYHSTTQAVSAGATDTVLFDSEEFDTDGFHSISTNTGRLTVPAGLSGKYLVTYHIHATSLTSTGPQIDFTVRKNGTGNGLRGSEAGLSTSTSEDIFSGEWVGHAVADLVAGDYLELRCFSTDAITIGHANSGIANTFSIMRLDSGSSAGGGGAHPDLAAHDTLGLATDAEMAAHAANAAAHGAYLIDPTTTAGDMLATVGGGNVALAGTASGSAGYPDSASPAGMIDGIEHIYGHPYGYRMDNAASGQWGKIDLGSAKTIASVRILTGTQSERRVSSYNLQYSTDNSAWTTAETLTGSPYVEIDHTFIIPSITARWWRILSGSATTYGWDIVEFQIFQATSLDRLPTTSAGRSLLNSSAGINALTDVDTATVAPTSGQALVWDGTQWEPGTVGGGSYQPLDSDLTAIAGVTRSPGYLHQPAVASVIPGSHGSDNGVHITADITIGTAGTATILITYSAGAAFYLQMWKNGSNVHNVTAPSGSAGTTSSVTTSVAPGDVIYAALNAMGGGSNNPLITSGTVTVPGVLPEWLAAIPQADVTLDWGETADITTAAFADAAAAGTADEIARADHRHGMPTAPSGGGGGGTSGSYLGYDAIGASWATIGTRQQLCKQITLTGSELIESIDAYLRPSTDQVAGLYATILADNAGAPGTLIAASGVASAYLSNSSSMPGAARWVSLPMGAYLPAGTYWICIMAEVNRYDIAHDTGGSDQYFSASMFVATGAYTSAWAITTSANKYSIRARLAGGSGGGGGGGALVYLAEQVASSSAQLDFTGFITADYDEYRFEFLNVLPATDNVHLLMRVGTGGGPTYDSGTNYAYATHRVGTAGAGVDGSNSATSIPVDEGSGTNGIKNTGGIGLSGSISLSNPLSTSVRKLVYGQTMTMNAFDSLVVGNMVSGWYTPTTALTAVRFLMSSGNIASGTIRVYGVAKVAGSGAAAAGNLLGRTFYKPTTQQNLSTSSATIVDVDATNLAVAFTAPASGSVIVVLEAGAYHSGGWAEFGVRESTTVLAVGRVLCSSAGGGSASRRFLITGLTPGSSHTYKFGFAAGSGGGTLNVYIRTDDPATDSSSIGPASIEVWAA